MTGSTKLEKNLVTNLSSVFYVLKKSVTRKIIDLQNLSNKDIHVTPKPDNTKHRPFQLMLWSNFIEGLKSLSPGIRGKVLTD